MPDRPTRALIDEQVRTAPIVPTPQPFGKPIRSPGAIAGIEVMADANITGMPNSSEAEVSLAQDRRRPQRVLAVTMTSPSGDLLALASDDRGASFHVTRIAPPAAGTGMGDPWVRFDSQGVAHMALLVGGASPAIGVTRSTDGGRSWNGVETLTPVGQDKPALIADDNDGSPFRDRIYIVWVRPGQDIRITRSNDGGASYEAPRTFDNLSVNGADLAVATDGTLYVAAQNLNSGQLYVWRSSDGGDRFARSTVAVLRAPTNVGNPADCRRNPLVQMSLAVDRTGGPRDGRVYLTWSDYPTSVARGTCTGNRCDLATPCAPDVFTARSVDGGRSWSPPVQVNPNDGGAFDQFHSSSAIDEATGTLYVSYHDTSLSSDRRASHVALTRSTDGGISFEAPARISTAESRSMNGFGYGDYRGMVATGGLTISVWSDYRADQNRGEIYVNRTRFGDGGGGGGGGGECTLPAGHPRFCVECGPCTDGQGDCDGDAQCAAGTVCIDNIGARFGFAGGIDVCIAPEGGGGGGPGTCSLPPGHPRFCVECGPCTDGQGDCDGNAQCANGTVCVDNVGADFGFPPGIDMCIAESGTPDACPLPPGHPRFCDQCGPCGRGQGDCDGDDQCARGLRCTEDTGPDFGFGARVDVCQ